jgi:hypothetical protein
MKKNLKEYIGKKFIGFEFDGKKYSFAYNGYCMNELIGKEMVINYYRKDNNSFMSSSGYLYPADLVIAQLEANEKPKRGDKVLVWDNKDENAEERIFLAEIVGAISSYICVCHGDEEMFKKDKKFGLIAWENMKPISEKVIEKDTLVWGKHFIEDVWEQRFYSHFENGKHYCFTNQKKSLEAKDVAYWEIVTDKNPFEL